MAATSGYQAGVEANATQISYGVEAVWGTAPVTLFQAIRYTSETLSGTKTRNRPQEINLTREASQGITTQEAAAGAISFALSYGTYDDFLSVCLGNDWQALEVIAGVSGDITITSGSNFLSSTTAGKFTNILVGQYVRLLGFTNAANNTIARVTAKASALSLTLAPLGSTFVTETPTGTAAQVRASSLNNGVQFKSLYIQQKLGGSLYLQYPGSYVAGFTITGGVGQFLSGSFDMAAQVERSATADASTGGVSPAPTGRVHDPVGSFGGVYWNGAAIAAVVDSFTIMGKNTGAAAEYGLGSATAAGMLAGMLEVSGKVKMYFKDFTYYANFKAETQGVLTFVTKDSAGNAYVIEVASAFITDPQIHATGPNTAVYAEFTVEGNPAAGTGGTLSVHRLASV